MGADPTDLPASDEIAGVMYMVCHRLDKFNRHQSASTDRVPPSLIGRRQLSKCLLYSIDMGDLGNSTMAHFVA